MENTYLYGATQYMSTNSEITLNPETGLLEGEINKIVAIRRNDTFGDFSFILDNGTPSPIGILRSEDDEEADGYYEQISLTNDYAEWRLIVDEETHAISLYNKTFIDIYLKCDGVDYYLGSPDKLPIYIYRYVGEASVTYTIDDTQVDGSRPALTYCHMILNLFADICSPDGNTNMQTLMGALQSCADSPLYKDLTSLSHELIRNTVADEDGDTIQKAMALYDYLVIKYKLPDDQLLHRHPTAPSSSNKLVIDSNNAAVFAVIMIGLLSTTALMFFLKKRKHN